MNTALQAGVMGWPVDHSLSPRLHGYWLKEYKIDGSYAALPVKPEDLRQELKSLHQKNFRGANLTVPHKEAALKIVDYLDPIAKRIGAVNAVITRSDGALEGRNTDAYGFTQNLLSAGVDIKNKPVTILGAGGASRAVIVALQDMGASEIRIVNRTLERAESLAQEFSTVHPPLAGLNPQGFDAFGWSIGEANRGGVFAFTWSAMNKALQNTALLVNTTSLGMAGQPELDIDLSGLPHGAAVTDIVYAPLQTDLLLQAKDRGHKTVDGLGMLLHQARPAFRAFFAVDPEVTDDLRHYVLEGK
jgi:shikimate dehydrogenase